MSLSSRPLIFNLYKPPGVTSYDVIRKLKKLFPQRPKKVGHFGTLDPFAQGVLLIGVNGATRLNEYIHEMCPKTYLAKGILGQETETGDMTSEISQKDESEYFYKEISRFSLEFIEEKLRTQFLGEYWQEPHKFSASKFEGRKLYEYAREGIEVKKEKKRREIYNLRVKNFEFPLLDIEFSVSSGTFIRTLFSDCARYLGTLGVLEGLIRTKIGSVEMSDDPIEDYLRNSVDLKKLLGFSEICLEEELVTRIKLGNFVTKGEFSAPEGEFFWISDEQGKLEALGKIDEEGALRPTINF